MKLTVPTMLTLLRILLIPVLAVVFYLPYGWTNFAAAAVFGLASLTDWLDGWIARRYHQYSAFGAFLDPVADKLMVATALFLIVQGHPTAWMALWAAVIVGREIAVALKVVRHMADADIKCRRDGASADAARPHRSPLDELHSPDLIGRRRRARRLARTTSAGRGLMRNRLGGRHDHLY